jgi:uncharacterized protein (DUF58 family)
MVEMHTVTVEWSGEAALGTVYLAAASRQNCKATLSEREGKAYLMVRVSHASLQQLRDTVDELMISLADIEGE